MGDPSLSPETIETIELAYLLRFDNGSLNFTLFQSDWQDAITIVPLTGFPPFVARRANVGENSAFGAEFSTRWLLKNWDISFSGSYARAEDELNDVTLDAFPEWIFNLGIGWAPTPSVDLYLSSRAHIGADEGEVVVDPGSGALQISPDELDDYLRTDINLTWHATSDVDVYLQLLNVFDRDNMLPSTLNSENGIPDLGFTVQAGIRWGQTPAK